MSSFSKQQKALYRRFLQATKEKNVPLAKQIVLSGADINHHNYVFHAMDIPSVELTELIIDRGLIAVDNSDYISSLSDLNMTKLFIRKFPNIVKHIHLNDVFYWGKNDLVDVLHEYIKAGVDVNQYDKDYDSYAIHAAIRFVHPPIVKLLIESGADLNVKCRNMTILEFFEHVKANSNRNDEQVVADIATIKTYLEKALKIENPS